ncbi:MAG: hypothetical protein WCV91_04090 [Candidatus Margulisiibacteriota bacterium]
MESNILEVGASPTANIRLINTSGKDLNITSGSVKVNIDPSIIDNIASFKIKNDFFSTLTENNYQNDGNTIDFSFVVPKGYSPIKIGFGKTVDLYEINFHLNQNYIVKDKRKIPLFKIVSFEVCSENAQKEDSGETDPLMMAEFANSASPIFNGINKVSSANKTGKTDIGNTLLIDWINSGNGAQDLTKYPNRKLHYRLFRSDIELTQGAPFAGNVEGKEYLYQDGPGDGTPGNAGISDGTIYKYKILAVDNASPQPNETKDPMVVEAISLDLTPPDDVLALSANAFNNGISLKWKNPANADLDGVIILKREERQVGDRSLGLAKAVHPFMSGPQYYVGDEPCGKDNGKVVYVGQAWPGIEQVFDDYEAQNGRRYFYRICTYDRAVEGPPKEMGRNYSNGIYVDQLTGMAPGPVSNFVGKIGNIEENEVLLAWDNPPEEYCKGVMIYYSTEESFSSENYMGTVPLSVGPLGHEELSIIANDQTQYYFKAIATNTTDVDPSSPDFLEKARLSSPKIIAVDLSPSAVEKENKVKASVIGEDLSSVKVKVIFDNQVYKEGSGPFIVSEKPKIKVLVTGDVSSLKKSEKLALSLDNKKVNNVVSAFVSNANDNFGNMNISYTPQNTLASGMHEMSFSFSYNENGKVMRVAEVLTFEVSSGPLRVIGDVLAYPSPFSSIKEPVSIQYTLSKNTNCKVILTASDGQIIKRWIFQEGADGGRVGLNKITWNGRADAGTYAGNAIYVGLIMSGDDNKVLGRFKVVVFNN